MSAASVRAVQALETHQVKNVPQSNAYPHTPVSIIVNGVYANKLSGLRDCSAYKSALQTMRRSLFAGR